MSHTVYAITLRGDPEQRYIGMTTQPIQCRLGNHLSQLPHSDFAVWLRANAAHVTIASIAECESRSDALTAEKDAIKAALASGHRLFNSNHVPGRRVRIASGRARIAA